MFRISAAAIGLAVASVTAIQIAVAAPFAQLSSGASQLAATADMPTAVTMNADAAEGVTVSGSQVTVAEAGNYFVIAAGQIGGTGVGSVKMWLRLNGTDVVNSNTEQVIPTPEFTAVLVAQGVLTFAAGDVVEVMYSATAPGLGLIFKSPAGEPAIPSIIFTMFKLP